jgi:hypothetical protein
VARPLNRDDDVYLLIRRNPIANVEAPAAPAGGGAQRADRR